jgi:hypothetical protein
LVQIASLAPDAASVSERSHGAEKGPALGGDVRLVVDEELGQHLIDVLGGAGAPQRFLDHHPRAETRPPSEWSPAESRMARGE